MKPTPVGNRGFEPSSDNEAVRCDECGAEFRGEQTCAGRFSELLLAEQEDEGLARMHGLTVLTYHLQHASLTKVWWQREARTMLHRLIVQREPYDRVFVRRRGEASRRYGRQLADLKATSTVGPTDLVRCGAIEGELTIADLDPTLHAGWEVWVDRWARSVARLRLDLAE